VLDLLQGVTGPAVARVEHVDQTAEHVAARAQPVAATGLVQAALVEAPADELWQQSEDDSDDDAAQAEQWPDSADHGAASLTDSGNDDQNETGDGSDDGNDDDYGEDDEDDEDEDPLHLGDIAISRDAVVRQAAAAGHSVAWECAYLFAHGLLHLMGYDDSTDAGYRAMVAHQEAVLTDAHITR